MRKREFVLAATLIITASAMLFAQSIQAPRYQLPPKEIIDAFEAPPLPQAILSPSRQVMALLYRRANPMIAELSRPMLRLAGARIDPPTNGPHLTSRIYAVTLKTISDGSEVKVTAPPQANLSNLHFSPDGTHLSFLNTRDNGIELWVAEVASGKAKMISGADRLNSTTGDPCDWLHDNMTLICELRSEEHTSELQSRGHLVCRLLLER